jgi:hypothetical protein
MAARKQQYVMFPAPISFLDDELKAELGMKAKKEKEDDTCDAFCSLRVLLNYSHSRNPPCAPERTHGRNQAPREPPN